MTTVNENVNTNEDIKTEDEVTELIGVGIDMYKKLKKSLLRRGFIMGLLTAVAVQSLLTIFMLIAYL